MDNFIENLDLASVGIWYPLALGMIGLLYILFMKKRLSWGEIYFIFGATGFVSITIDVFLMLNYLDVFDLGSHPEKEGIGDYVCYAIIPPCFAVIFSNYVNLQKKWLYTIIFIFLSLLSEWTLVQVGYMQLKGWFTLWSTPVFIFVYGLWLPWQLKLLRSLQKS
ncbi:hypothetical protein [Metabacillus sp. Hm71]|uniref:hypothetical protein n=1 Tax=Metabacillus sp. Hm71 TaxID=3450743 RepID=UPI003F43DD00